MFQLQQFLASLLAFCRQRDINGKPLPDDLHQAAARFFALCKSPEYGCATTFGKNVIDRYEQMFFSNVSREYGTPVSPDDYQVCRRIIWNSIIEGLSCNLFWW